MQTNDKKSCCEEVVNDNPKSTREQIIGRESRKTGKRSTTRRIGSGGRKFEKGEKHFEMEVEVG